MYIKIRKSKPLCSFSFTYVLFFFSLFHINIVQVIMPQMHYIIGIIADEILWILTNE